MSDRQDNTMAAGSRGERSGSWILLALAFAAGLALRLDQFGSQVVGGDEWNSLRFAVQYDLVEIFTRFNIADNCVPLTVYFKILLALGAVTEWTLRMPQLVAGVAALMVLPLLFRKVLGLRGTWIFAFLLALSPFLDFYSRFARPYMIVAFLSAVALWAFHRWQNTGRWRDALLYLACAVMAAYFNLFALFFAGAPMLYAVAAPGNRKKALGLAAMFTAGMALVIGPRLGTIEAIAPKVGGGLIDHLTLKGTLHQFYGTPSLTLEICLVLASAAGIVELFRRDKGLFAVVLTALAFSISALIVVNPSAGQSPLVFARYAVSVLPFLLLALALAADRAAGLLDRFFRQRARLFVSIAILLGLGGYFLHGPLLDINRRHNNFTNHNDYQLDYGLQVMTIGPEQVDRFPAFYRRLLDAPADTKIIECPYFAMWRLNTCHVYQRYHRKRVFVGHLSGSYLSHARPMMHEGVNFAGFVNLEKPITCGAKYAVFHTDLLNEMLYLRAGWPLYGSYLERVRSDLKRLENTRGIPARKQAALLVETFRQRFGPPIYEDQWITVFQLQ